MHDGPLITELQRWFYLIVGVGCAVVTSLKVLDPQALMWAQDEGYFLALGSAGSTLLDLRYGLFSIVVFLYFQITSTAFVIVLIHKVITLVIFIFVFQEKISRDHSSGVFALLFLTFVYLNAYFLRDALIFLTCLMAVTHGASDRTIKSAGWLVPLALLRPQSVLFFIRPWLSLTLLALFLTFSRPLFAAVQVQDNGLSTILSPTFWGGVARLTMSTLSNLNPIPKYGSFMEQGLYVEYGLLVLASVPLFAVLANMTLALVLPRFRFQYFHRVWVGLGCTLALYGSLGIAADVRVLYASLVPVFIFVHKSLLKWRYLALLTLALILAAALRDVAKLALGMDV